MGKSKSIEDTRELSLPKKQVKDNKEGKLNGFTMNSSIKQNGSSPKSGVKLRRTEVGNKSKH